MELEGSLPFQPLNPVLSQLSSVKTLTHTVSLRPILIIHTIYIYVLQVVSSLQVSWFKFSVHFLLPMHATIYVPPILSPFRDKLKQLKTTY
jgi:hypothetical protein